MTITRLTFVVLLAALATSVQAETVNCTPITSLPATITTPGIYCLTGNLGTSQSSGNAITITANYVTLDLNGHKLDGHTAGTGTTAIGISSTGTDVTIKNGIVRAFYRGIYLTGAGAVVQDMLIDSNTFIGITADGIGSLVEHNQVVNTGGAGTGAAIGIDIEGSNETVSNNIVSGVTAQLAAHEYGILIYNSTAQDNVVSNTSIPGANASYGISSKGSIDTNNKVSTFSYCITSDSASIYSFNTVNNCQTDFSGGTDGSGNSGT
ncbi:MAG: hypothetical protein WBR15_06580 [Gammaproteobacteria bacterium]